jgi:hypothetical protein
VPCSVDCRIARSHLPREANIPTLLEFLKTHFGPADDIELFGHSLAVFAERTLAKSVKTPAVTTCPSIPFGRPEEFEALKLTEGLVGRLMAFSATIGAIIIRVAELPGSRGYQPYLTIRGVGPIAAHGIAALVVRHGKRLADERERRRAVVQAIRFLGKRRRQRRAISPRAKAILAVWDETAIIEEIFADADLGAGEFIGLLKSVVEGGEVDRWRITEIAADVSGHLPTARGKPIRASSAAHEFFLEEVVSFKVSRAYTWSNSEEDFTDPETLATRQEFNDPDFDPRPAHRRLMKRRLAH